MDYGLAGAEQLAAEEGVQGGCGLAHSSSPGGTPMDHHRVRFFLCNLHWCNVNIYAVGGHVHFRRRRFPSTERGAAAASNGTARRETGASQQGADAAYDEHHQRAEATIGQRDHRL